MAEVFHGRVVKPPRRLINLIQVLTLTSEGDIPPGGVGGHRTNENRNERSGALACGWFFQPAKRSIPPTFSKGACNETCDQRLA